MTHPLVLTKISTRVLTYPQPGLPAATDYYLIEIQLLTGILPTGPTGICSACSMVTDCASFRFEGGLVTLETSFAGLGLSVALLS